MAVSAFRSTTRRGCQRRGSGGDATTSGVPSTPGRPSRRDPFRSPSVKGSHYSGRSSSISSISSSKYLSDCEHRSSQARRYGKTSSVRPSDSENEADYLVAHHQIGHKAFTLEDQGKKNTALLEMSTNNTQTNSKRSLRNQNLSQFLQQSGFKTDEEFVEDKTIEHVFAKMKSLKSVPPVADPGPPDLVDAMRSEVQRAVAEIRSELEESMQKKCNITEVHDKGSAQRYLGENAIMVVSDVRNEYSAKLDQSEKRVRELWSELAVEEQRCLELAKIVKELLPATVSGSQRTSGKGSNRRRSHKRRNSAEKPEPLSLDDEALKYFEDCLSTSTFNGETDDSHGETDHCVCDLGDLLKRSALPEQHAVTRIASSEAVKCSGSSPPRDTHTQSCVAEVESDGIVLPWLDWEADIPLNEKSPKKVKRWASHKSSTIGGNIVVNIANTGSSKPFDPSKPDSMKRAAMSELEISGNVLFPAARTAKSTVCTIEEHGEHRNCSMLTDPEAFLLGKINFTSRLEARQLVMCQGLFI